MVIMMASIWRNQVIGSLQAKTVDKFEDAQMGNFASIFLGLSKSVNRKLIKRFDDDRIESLTKNILGKVNKKNQEDLYGNVEDKIGISQKLLVQTEGLKPRTNALMLETAQWSKKMLHDTLEEFTANTLRGMTLGLSVDEILAEFDDLVGKRRENAKFVARNQISNFNSIMTKTRAQNLGIEEAIWVTSRDGNRVRECHRDRDRKKFRLDEGLFSSCDGKTLLPGVDFNCRCTYELLVPEE